MSKVREELGLTYHIVSGFGGMSGDDIEGHWVVNLTANSELLDSAVQETKKQIELFVKDGVPTPEELDRKKGAVIGKFKVELATTSGLATWILKDEELGLGVKYLDEFPLLVKKLKLEEVNYAIPHYFRSDHLSTVIAGDVQN